MLKVTNKLEISGRDLSSVDKRKKHSKQSDLINSSSSRFRTLGTRPIYDEKTAFHAQ